MTESQATPAARGGGRAGRYVTSLAGEAWAVQSADHLRAWAQALTRPGELAAYAPSPERMSANRADETPVHRGVAVVELLGPIFPRANLFTEMCGGVSCQDMAARLDALARRADVGAILLEIDSPGGAVTGVDDLARTIRAVGRTKPVVAQVTGTAASAAYWLAAAASEIALTRTAGVGSIGVVAALSKQLAPDGQGEMAFEIVSSGAPDKRPDPETEAGSKTVRQRLDAIEALFVEAVAEGRGVTAERVRTGFGRGGILTGQAAVDAGMADRLASRDETLARLQARIDVPQPQAKTVTEETPTMSDSIDPQPSAQPADPSTVQPTPPAAPDPAPGSVPASATAAASEPAADPAAVAQLCADKGVAHLAAGLIRDGAPLSAVEAQVRACGEIHALCDRVRGLNPDFPAAEQARAYIAEGLSPGEAYARAFDWLADHTAPATSARLAPGAGEATNDLAQAAEADLARRARASGAVTFADLEAN
ncbi:hypothetical protein CCR85_01260 [Rhodothalassium salexigens]|uniref:S49 family peptidase n=1 Tax=Rhodothalassium salexigens TaxID=1086 RepID=UPI00191175D3|nr:S49 family peptidase [Rhodothalassium salexigens]MBK5910121.1 hypothetical protein [Rhodothalassium salexigens]MBK5920734.1 hypothetical protein [Rhodothalassium salexigens]